MKVMNLECKMATITVDKWDAVDHLYVNKLYQQQYVNTKPLPPALTPTPPTPLTGNGPITAPTNTINHLLLDPTAIRTIHFI